MMKHIIKHHLIRLLGLSGYQISKVGRMPSNLLAVIFGHLVDGVGTIIQVGANDGVSNDPISSYLRGFRGRVVLIEPQPDAFQTLQANWAPVPSNVSLINCAIAERDENIVMYRIAPEKHAEYQRYYKATANASGITSVDRSHVLTFLNKVVGHVVPANEIENWISKLDVDAISVRTLIDKYSIEHVDLLQIDAEGYDYQILKQFLALDILPNVINFEFKHLNSSDQENVLSDLNARGYSTWKHSGDMLAFRAINFL